MKQSKIKLISIVIIMMLLILFGTTISNAAYQSVIIENKEHNMAWSWQLFARQDLESRLSNEAFDEAKDWIRKGGLAFYLYLGTNSYSWVQDNKYDVYCSENNQASSTDNVRDMRLFLTAYINREWKQPGMAEAVGLNYDQPGSVYEHNQYWDYRMGAIAYIATNFSEHEADAKNPSSKWYWDNKSYFMSGFRGTIAAAFSYHIPYMSYYEGSNNNIYKNLAQLGTLYDDAMAYSNFATSISAGYVGKTIDSKSTSGENVMVGNNANSAKVGPFTFNRIIIDNYQYGDTEGTKQEINASVKLSNGTSVNTFKLINDTKGKTITITNGENIKNKLLVDASLEVGDKFYIQVDGNGINLTGATEINCTCTDHNCPNECNYTCPCNGQMGSTSKNNSVFISNVTFTSGYTAYRGSVYYVGDRRSTEQARFMLQGEKKRVSDEVVFTGTYKSKQNCQCPPAIITPQTPVVPVMVIQKTDENGQKIAGANLDIYAGGYHVNNGSIITRTDQDITIDFDELYSGSSQFKNDIGNTQLNNISKVLQYGVQNGGNDRLLNAIKDLIKKNVRTAVENSNTWKKYTEDAKKSHITEWNSTYYGPYYCTDLTKCKHKDKEGNCKGYYVGAWVTHYGYRSDCAKCVADSKIRGYNNELDTFSKNVDGMTFEQLRPWIEAERVDTNICDGVLSSTGVGISYSMIDAYNANLITGLDIMRVFSGTLTVQITENSAPSGYVAWQNEKTKTVNVKYVDGSIVNGMSNYNSSWDNTCLGNCRMPSSSCSNCTTGKKCTCGCTHTYLRNTNDEVEVEHKGIRDYTADASYDKTYDITKIIAYNEKNKDIFKLNKYGDFNSFTNSSYSKKQINAKFDITITATENYWDGDSRTKKFEAKDISTNGNVIKYTVLDYNKNLGIDVLSRWTGIITIKVVEKDVENGYIKSTVEYNTTVEYNKGKATITNSGLKMIGESEIEKDGSLKIDMYNESKDVPEFIIKKEGTDGQALKGAKFTGTVEANGKSVSFSGTTNELGEIIKYSDNIDLNKLGIYNLNRWTGTLTIRMKETEAPEGYLKINGEIVITVKYQYGKGVVSANATRRRC